MLYVALVLAAALVVVVVAGAGLVRSQQRAYARERDLLLNQLLHVVGRDWQPAPADTWTPPPLPDEVVRVWPGAAEQSEVY